MRTNNLLIFNIHVQTIHFSMVHQYECSICLCECRYRGWHVVYRKSPLFAFEDSFDEKHLHRNKPKIYIHIRCFFYFYYIFGIAMPFSKNVHSNKHNENIGIHAHIFECISNAILFIHCEHYILNKREFGNHIEMHSRYFCFLGKTFGQKYLYL